MVPSRLERALNGIQAGMTGGLAMTAVAVIVFTFEARAWWSHLNLLAVHFYGPRALAMGPSWATLAGLALQLAIAGVAGALFALLFSGVMSGARLALFGVAWGVALFFVSEQVHHQVTPLVAVHIERGPMLAAHALFGLLLASIPHRERTIERPGVVSLPVPPVETPAEQVSPEPTEVEPETRNP
jgi:hypothetical protein